MTEQSVETTATPEAIWRQWSGVGRWPEWNGDIERIELGGPFATGSHITMTPIGDEPVELRIAQGAEPELFVDEAAARSSCGRFTVSSRSTPAGRVTYRLGTAGIAMVVAVVATRLLARQSRAVAA